MAGFNLQLYAKMRQESGQKLSILQCAFFPHRNKFQHMSLTLPRCLPMIKLPSLFETESKWMAECEASCNLAGGRKPLLSTNRGGEDPGDEVEASWHWFYPQLTQLSLQNKLQPFPFHGQRVFGLKDEIIAENKARNTHDHTSCKQETHYQPVSLKSDLGQPSPWEFSSCRARTHVRAWVVRSRRNEILRHFAPVDRECLKSKLRLRLCKGSKTKQNEIQFDDLYDISLRYVCKISYLLS